MKANILIFFRSYILFFVYYLLLKISFSERNLQEWGSHWWDLSDRDEGDNSGDERKKNKGQPKSKNIAGRVDSKRSRLVWSYHNLWAKHREWF